MRFVAAAWGCRGYQASATHRGRSPTPHPQSHRRPTHPQQQASFHFCHPCHYGHNPHGSASWNQERRDKHQTQVHDLCDLDNQALRGVEARQTGHVLTTGLTGSDRWPARHSTSADSSGRTGRPIPTAEGACQVGQAGQEPASARVQSSLGLAGRREHAGHGTDDHGSAGDGSDLPI